MSTFNDFESKVSELQIENACVFAMLTDEIIFDNWPVPVNEDKLLDIRVFNRNKEVRMFRTSIGKAFSNIRVADDADEKYKDHIDEWQILDIDTEASKEAKDKVISTGGGRYTLPKVENVCAMDKSNKPAVKIVKYIAYTEFGQAYIYDWRLAGIEMRGLDQLEEKEDVDDGKI